MNLPRPFLARAWGRRLSAAVLSGVLAGIIGGIGARLAMRIVADASLRFPEFTFEGTLNVLLIGTFVGIALGILFILLESRMPRRPFGKSVGYAIVVFILLGIPLVLRPAAGELALGPPLLGKVLFGALIFVYGLCIGATEGWIEQHLPEPKGRLIIRAGYTVLAGVGAALFLLFAGLVISSFFASAAG
jgi:hypothetical protein